MSENIKTKRGIGRMINYKEERKKEKKLSLSIDFFEDQTFSVFYN